MQCSLFFFTAALKPNRVTALEYEFKSGRTYDELAQDVYNQFGGTSLMPPKNATFPMKVLDLGGGYILTFMSVLTKASYSLQLHGDSNLEKADADAIRTERLRTNPPPKF